MTEPTSDRPLVTFALFAYNQEGFIRDAVHAALEQTYTPLEIILSDDCSSDSTFAIMQEMVAAYDGPHRVMARRNSPNLGTAMHVQSVANQMLGEFMIVAAGDDISRSDRVEVLINAWVESGRNAVVLHSWTHALYEGDAEPSETIKFKVNEVINLKWRLRNRKGAILAPTAAYRRSLFESFPPLIGGSFIEDGPMIVRGFLTGPFLGIPMPLVIQRKLATSLGSGYSASNPARWNAFVRSKIISQFNKIQDIGSLTITPDMEVLERQVHRDLRRLAKCTLPATCNDTFFFKVQTFFRILIFYPGTYTPSRKILFSLNFSGFKLSTLKKNIGVKSK